MMEIELTQSFPVLPRDAGAAWVLVRLNTEPIGSIQVSYGDGGLDRSRLADLIWARLRQPIEARLSEVGLVGVPLDPGGIDFSGAVSPYLRQREQLLKDSPRISVIVCTRDRTDRFAASLERLRSLSYPTYEIVVVDNAPRSDAVRRLVDASPESPPCRYVPEPRPGLSWARNAGLAVAQGEVVAFIDDDETPDVHWLAEIVRAFAGRPDVGCVSGMILPAQLETPAQVWFERFGGHSKGRGFTPATFSRDGQQSPLYPLPPFGAGGNMAFRAEVLRDLGGFDVALGAGAPTRGAEDTLAISLVMMAGYRVAYQPSAFVKHEHYRDEEGLARQLEGYGVGLTAYYAALIARRPAVVFPLMRLLPSALRYLRGRDPVNRDTWEAIPERFKRLQRRGMLRGPARYLRSRSIQRRLGKA